MKELTQQEDIMKTFMNYIYFLATALLLSGCASSFQKPKSSANYGIPPVNYEQTIKEYFESVLKDPESARYRFSQPIKAYENEGLLFGGKVAWLGYLVDTQVNAKNSYGGYVGYKPYVFLFNGSQIRHVYEGSEFPWVHRVK